MGHAAAAARAPAAGRPPAAARRLRLLRAPRRRGRRLTNSSTTSTSPARNGHPRRPREQLRAHAARGGAEVVAGGRGGVVAALRGARAASARGAGARDGRARRRLEVPHRVSAGPAARRRVSSCLGRARGGNRSERSTGEGPLVRAPRRRTRSFVGRLVERLCALALLTLWRWWGFSPSTRPTARCPRATAATGGAPSTAARQRALQGGVRPWQCAPPPRHFRWRRNRPVRGWRHQWRASSTTTPCRSHRRRAPISTSRAALPRRRAPCAGWMCSKSDAPRCT